MAGDGLSESLMLPRTMKKNQSGRGMVSEGGQPIFDQENFGIKVNKLPPQGAVSEQLKINKRVSTPTESVGSKSFARPGQAWKMSMQAPVDKPEDVKQKETSMFIERRPPGGEPLQSRENNIFARPLTIQIEPKPAFDYQQGMFPARPQQTWQQAAPKPDNSTWHSSQSNGMDEERLTISPASSELINARERKQLNKRQLQGQEENIDDLRRNHQNLIDKILEDEDSILIKQKDFIDMKVAKIKEEMSLLNSIEKGDCGYQDYIAKMKEFIASQMKIEQSMLAIIQDFEEKLGQEKVLSIQIQQRENSNELLNVFGPSDATSHFLN